MEKQIIILIFILLGFWLLVEETGGEKHYLSKFTGIFTNDIDKNINQYWSDFMTGLKGLNPFGGGT